MRKSGHPDGVEGVSSGWRTTVNARLPRSHSMEVYPGAAPKAAVPLSFPYPPFRFRPFIAIQGSEGTVPKWSAVQTVIIDERSGLSERLPTNLAHHLPLPRQLRSQHTAAPIGSYQLGVTPEGRSPSYPVSFAIPLRESSSQGRPDNTRQLFYH